MKTCANFFTYVKLRHIKRKSLRTKNDNALENKRKIGI